MELIEETIGMSRLEELENALLDLFDLYDSESLVINPYLDGEEKIKVQSMLDRISAVMYEEDEDEQN